MSRAARIFISVCEESADVHAASLVRAARARQAADPTAPVWEFYGLTGPRLRELGVATVFDFASHAAMLGGVLGVLGKAYRAFQAVERCWRQRRPDVVVLLDSPELHLKLARRARQLGIPVLYYIAPQTWASRAYRNRQIFRDVDRLACILPFEEAYFSQAAGHMNRARAAARGSPSPSGSAGQSEPERQRGADPSPSGSAGPIRARAAARGRPEPERQRGADRPPITKSADHRFNARELPPSPHTFYAEFVGHPLFEALRREKPDPDTIAFLNARAAGRPIVALLPGSRRHVVAAMLPRQLEVLRRLRTNGRDVHAAISCVSDERRPQIREILAASADSLHLPASSAVHSGTVHVATAPGGAASRDAALDVVVADNASLLTAADLVLVASGTATLHVAHYRKPMIVMYDAGQLLYWPHRLLGRYLLSSQHLSLVNILADARIVPEFMPFVRPRDVDAIATVARQLLTDDTWRKLMMSQLDAVVRPLEESAASENVCRIIKDLLDRAQVTLVPASMEEH